MSEEDLINIFLVHQHKQAEKYLIVDDLCDALNKEFAEIYLRQASEGDGVK